MKTVLFVCHGNICRSPMAMFIFRELVRRAGKENELRAFSRATSTEETGNGLYPEALSELRRRKIPVGPHAAMRMSPEDYRESDLVFGMDDANMRNMARCFGGDPDRKLHMLLDYAGRPGEDVADPWYTRDFEATWQDLWAGCLGLLNTLHPHVTLDFYGCRERSGLYAVMRRAMLWQDWYGENLDALHDILTGQAYYGRTFTFILPADDAPCRSYAERIVREFEDAGLPNNTER